PQQGQAGSPNPASAAGKPQAEGAQAASPSAAASEAPSTASPSASAPTVRAVPTPLGGNAEVQTREPLPLFAYLLIILGALWFFAALAGIMRLLSRPRTMMEALPPAERDRPFLSFFMPLGALITVAVILSAWGLLFLWTAHFSEIYPLAIDLFVVCLVMLIATVAALKGGGQTHTEVH